MRNSAHHPDNPPPRVLLDLQSRIWPKTINQSCSSSCPLLIFFFFFSPLLPFFPSLLPSLPKNLQTPQKTLDAKFREATWVGYSGRTAEHVVTLPEGGPAVKLDYETLPTLLLQIIPNDFLKAMRELLTQERYINDYHGFEQALFDETRKMDEDARKQNRGIHAVGNNTEVLEQDNTSPHLYQNDIEYETVQIWSEEWQCHVSGLAPRERERSRSRSRGEMKKNKRSKDKEPSDEYQKLGKGSEGRGRPRGPCWTCGGPHFQRECPHASAGKGNYPTTTAWSSWRPGTFPGSSAVQWNLSLPKPKGKGERQRQKQRRQRRFQR